MELSERALVLPVAIPSLQMILPQILTKIISQNGADHSHIVGLALLTEGLRSDSDRPVASSEDSRGAERLSTSYASPDSPVSG